jgi:hypothetical protein
MPDFALLLVIYERVARVHDRQVVHEYHVASHRVELDGVRLGKREERCQRVGLRWRQLGGGAGARHIRRSNEEGFGEGDLQFVVDASEDGAICDDRLAGFPMW